MAGIVAVYEDSGFRNLLPLTYWHAVYELRCGQQSLLDRIIRHYNDCSLVLYCRPELADVLRSRYNVPVNTPPDQLGDNVLYINGRVLLDGPLPEIPPDGRLGNDHTTYAWRTGTSDTTSHSPGKARAFYQDVGIPHGANMFNVSWQEPAPLIGYPWDLIRHNATQLTAYWQEYATGIEGIVSEGVHIVDRPNVHVGPGSVIKPGVVLDASEGPIYIGDDVKVEANAVIIGPSYIGDGTKVQAQALIRENCSIGSVCKVGGEIEDCILHSYSNKQHHGFLGHSYVGQWVNMGAGTTNSDLKNTYGQVRVQFGPRQIDTGEIFVGACIADHSKTGINVSLSTGAMMGFSSNVFVSSTPPKFIPSFAWLTDQDTATYDAEKGLAVAQRMMQRRKMEMSDAEKELFLAMPAIVREYEQTSADA